MKRTGHQALLTGYPCEPSGRIGFPLPASHTTFPKPRPALDVCSSFPVANQCRLSGRDIPSDVISTLLL
jgi:hypothetical protein